MSNSRSFKKHKLFNLVFVAGMVITCKLRFFARKSTRNFLLFCKLHALRAIEIIPLWESNLRPHGLKSEFTCFTKFATSIINDIYM